VGRGTQLLTIIYNSRMFLPPPGKLGPRTNEKFQLSLRKRLYHVIALVVHSDFQGVEFSAARIRDFEIDHLRVLEELDDADISQEFLSPLSYHHLASAKPF
jgi:hypothetical protein